jgi:hypothetical protein
MFVIAVRTREEVGSITRKIPEQGELSSLRIRALSNNLPGSLEWRSEILDFDNYIQRRIMNRHCERRGIARIGWHWLRRIV